MLAPTCLLSAIWGPRLEFPTIDETPALAQSGVHGGACTCRYVDPLPGTPQLVPWRWPDDLSCGITKASQERLKQTICPSGFHCYRTLEHEGWLGHPVLANMNATGLECIATATPWWFPPIGFVCWNLCRIYSSDIFLPFSPGTCLQALLLFIERRILPPFIPDLAERRSL
jgi:hypothetical protein